jgi:hypothetical protein
MVAAVIAAQRSNGLLLANSRVIISAREYAAIYWASVK